MNPDFLFKLLEGQLIDGKYHLKKLLGVGGFGAVFRADEVVRDRVLREVAVKVILPTGTADDQNRQLDELLTAVNLDHPHIIRCFAAGEFTYIDASWLYLVMELAEYSLQTQVERQPLGNAEIKEVIVQLARALEYLHDQQLVHQDLKPANVLWAKKVWKISDFGTVRSLSTQSYLQTANSTGTIAYMPPEAFDGVVSSAWDIWSLGILGVVAATRALPYQFADTNALLKQVMNADLQLSSLPSDLKAVIQPCLQPERRNRCTAKQVIQAITTPRHQPVVPPARLQEPEPSLPQPQGQNYQETLSKGIFSKTILEMVAIPGGKFLMGSPAGEGHSDEHPLHRVTVPSFYMGKYAVTNAQWKAVMGSNPASKYGIKFQGDHQPVVGVSWDDAQSFCQKLSQMSGKIYRLPSEAEWEYACRAGTEKNLYSFGSNENQLGKYAWYGNNSSGQTHPVGKKQGNTFGLYDMHGNVWEWCEDDWHDNYKSAPDDGRAWIEADRSKTKRVLRGGSWFNGPELCRSAYRFVKSRDFRGSPLNVHGFRVCCMLPKILP